MDEPRIEVHDLASLTADPKNPRARTERGRKTLRGSIREFGPARSAVIDSTGVIRAGNGTVEAALAEGITKALVVDAPADTLVVVRKHWSQAQGRAYSVLDNQATDLSVFTDDGLEEVFEDLDEEEYDLTSTGFTEEEISFLRDDEEEEVADEDAEEQAPLDLFRVWPSDNEWGVPTLDASLQGCEADLREGILNWGSRRRGKDGWRLIHFYTDDHKFWSLHANPRIAAELKCQALVEPNYSTRDDMARAEALWWIHSKRVIARWWQTQGLSIFVDLNVDFAFEDLMLLGVPIGWRAYATRFHRGNTIADLERDYQIACARRQDSDVLFVVVGGGAKVLAACAERGWVHVVEDASRARGKE